MQSHQTSGTSFTGVDMICKFCHCTQEDMGQSWVVEGNQPSIEKAFSVCSCPHHCRDAFGEEAYLEAVMVIFNLVPGEEPSV